MRMLVMFQKTARVRYLGHLDLQRAVQRALRRSGLPVRYSQGFNPHAVLSFASPLPVGMSGAEELYDVALEREVDEAAFLDALSRATPPSLPIVRVRAVDDRAPALMASLRTASYRAAYPVCDFSRAMAAAIPSLLASETLPAVRKTKSGETPCDIRPMIRELSGEETPDAVVVAMRVAFTERETLKPDLLLSVLAARAGAEPPRCLIERTRLYGETDRGPVCLMDGVTL